MTWGFCTINLRDSLTSSMHQTRWNSKRQIIKTCGQVDADAPHLDFTGKRNAFVVLSLVILLCLVERTASAPLPFGEKTQYVNHNTSQDSLLDSPNVASNEEVLVFVRAMLSQSGSKDVTEFPLNTHQDVADFRKHLTQLGESIEVTIQRNSTHSITLYLRRNSFVVTKDFIRKYFSASGEPIIEKAGKNDAALSHCYFNGKVLANVDSLATVSLCHGLKGTIEISDKVFTIDPLVAELSFHHILDVEDTSLEDVESGECGTNYTDDSNHRHHKYRRRLTRELRMPAGSSANTRYVELYIVMDRSMYEMTGSVDATVMRAINIANYVSALYRPLDMYIALTGVEVWNERNKIDYVPHNNTERLDSLKLLAAFNRYRHLHINFYTRNDNGQLVTATRFEYGVIGKGSTTSICSQVYSGGVSFDGSKSNYIKVATTLAHEMGHNLGLPHSNSRSNQGKDCECPAPDDPEFKDCIMHSSSSAYRQSRIWSPCTVKRLKENFVSELDYCLKNEPEKLLQVGNTPICGNFFVETGEECDCGQPADCESKCCDASTCKLYSNATCATGACCDLETCSLRPKAYPCRSIPDGYDCELAEHCGGTSEWCPPNTYKKDGTPCNKDEPGYCYSGKCGTHNSQCKFIWGETASNSDDACYKRYNNHSSYYGNCGYETNSDAESYTRNTVERNYKYCKKPEDLYCGLLHCQYDQSVVKKPRIRVLSLVLYPQPWDGHLCAVSSFDAGYKVYDPGQIPDGAKCSNNSMCVNSRCVPVKDFPDICHCNGHGVCNQLNQCHCDIGWAPPSCDHRGTGGSISSNPPVTLDGSNIMLTASLVSVFGILIIVAIVVVVGYHRRHDLKEFFHTLNARFRSDSQSSQHQDQKRPKAENQANSRKKVKRQQGTNGKQAVISPPVLQSTTNDRPQMNRSVPLQPSRAAPPPPNIPPGSTKNLRTVYENVNPKPPPTLPKPPASRVASGGVRPSAPPRIPPKPNLSRPQ